MQIRQSDLLLAQQRAHAQQAHLEVDDLGIKDRVRRDIQHTLLQQADLLDVRRNGDGEGQHGVG
ncbi:hypothetical protein GALL_486050 [mine drainage metagenome]|uniref:Uncharacterized protein n=1 Tax=mine drainage metagenome TaxID=410659 RepID=A0A1J5Q1P8_9ZZZZ